MKPVLIIPSYDRPDGAAIERCKLLPLQKFLFIRPEQKALYKKWRPYYKLITQKDGTDIGKVRRNIVNYCVRHNINWAFVFDDDITKVESVGQEGDKITSKRILYFPELKPRFEISALQNWYKIAVSHNLALSSPSYRPFTRFAYPQLIINGQQCIQCVLLHIPDIASVGNYRSLSEVGAEDMYIQYKLMKSGYNCGSISLIEYDCPSVGQGDGGNNSVENSDLQQRYEDYVNTFYQKVCNDSSLIRIKRTKTGIPSVSFVWSRWNSRKITLEETDE